MLIFRSALTTEFLQQKYKIHVSNDLLNTYKSKVKNYCKCGNKIYNTPYTKHISEEDIKFQMTNQPQIVFEVTERCNLKCHYCSYGDLYNWYDSRNGSDLDINYAKSLIQYVVDMQNSKYCLSNYQEIIIGFYGGEPLLIFDFVKEIVLFTKTLCTENLYFTFSMTSNCVFLDKYMDFLAEHNFDLLISLDGNQYHNSYRVFHNGKESFPIVFNNVKQLKQKHPHYYKKHVLFNAVLHNRNSIQEVQDFIITNFGKEPGFSDFSTEGLDRSKKESILQMFQNREECLYQSEDYFGEDARLENLEIDFEEVKSFFVYQTNLVYPTLMDLYANRNRPIKPTATCLPFSRKIYMTANGKILPCENAPHQYAMGYVSGKGVSIDYKVAPCNKCIYNFLCPPPSNYNFILKCNNLCTIHVDK